ncbi:MAG: inorganic phosphate transporter [Hyphomicrobiaceae bacterium]|nr:inorganic phosphate transporter [Hyphomicrobiaceae bacterium]
MYSSNPPTIDNLSSSTDKVALVVEKRALAGLGTARISQLDFVKFAVSLLFLAGIMIWVNNFLELAAGGGTFLVVAAIVGGYMAMNIGANDVANNVGPAVGSGALTMTGAVVLAAVFEISGALVAGGDVVGTIKKGIIDPALIADSSTFIWLMLAALLAGAIWLNIATIIGAPVSTTHSIVGGVLGAGIAAGGWEIANWDKMATIAASWVISPLLGGLIAAMFLYLITRLIIDQKNLMGAARQYVPYIMAVMAWAFATYLILKGLKKIWHVDFLTAGFAGLVVGVLVFVFVRPMISYAATRLENTRESINTLFTVPLIFSAALLSFAHGANDVANAVGPLAAITDTLSSHDVSAKAAIPLWVMIVGALGLAVGLALYGPKLIRTVGSEITHLDKTRAFCVALAAAITVIIASQMGLPVSSTHIAVGGVFGVGFLREYLQAYRARMDQEIKNRIKGDDPKAVAQFLELFQSSAFAEQGEMVKELRKNACDKLYLGKKDRKDLTKVYREELVKRSMVIKIAAAWVITVPVSGLMAAFLYYAIRGIMLP